MGGATVIARRPQPWPIRIAHWTNVPLLALMAGSGLQILVAFPSLGPRGRPYAWYPWNSRPPPTWLRLGDWLAGARHVHFAFAWFLVGNALVYLVYLLASGEWRRRYFVHRGDLRNALATAAHYLHLRREEPPHGFYNGLQRLAYTAAMALGAVQVLSGLAIYKPIQLGRLAALFGGYDGARAVHLLGLIALAAFVAGHVVMVALHPRSLVEMVSGGRPRAEDSEP
jgi:thiosulfate reductase cytochrome b subunit